MTDVEMDAYADSQEEQSVIFIPLYVSENKINKMQKQINQLQNEKQILIVQHQNKVTQLTEEYESIITALNEENQSLLHKNVVIIRTLYNVNRLKSENVTLKQELNKVTKQLHEIKKVFEKE